MFKSVVCSLNVGQVFLGKNSLDPSCKIWLSIFGIVVEGEDPV